MAEALLEGHTLRPEAQQAVNLTQVVVRIVLVPASEPHVSWGHTTHKSTGEVACTHWMRHDTILRRVELVQCLYTFCTTIMWRISSRGSTLAFVMQP